MLVQQWPYLINVERIVLEGKQGSQVEYIEFYATKALHKLHISERTASCLYKFSRPPREAQLVVLFV